MESARDAFLEALALDPGDRVTRFNLEWTLNALAGRPPPARDEPPPPPDPESSESESPQPETSPQQARPEPEESDAPRRPPTPTLDDEQRERWLGRISDDLAHAARSAAAAGAGEARERAGPVW